MVGDEDQSIYRWRGADYRNVLRFEQDFPDCQKILLEQNYRSTQTVLDAARAVIDRNPTARPSICSPSAAKAKPSSCTKRLTITSKPPYVVDTIQTADPARQSKGGDFAVMYRTNAQSRLLEEAFLRAGCPTAWWAPSASTAGARSRT